MRSSHRNMALAAVAALSVAGAAVVAVAQPAPPAPPAAPGAPVTRERQVIIQRSDGIPGRIERGDRDGRRGGFDRGRRGGPDRMAMNPEARAERLRTLLQLTPAQNGALTAYLAAMAPPAMPAAAPRPASDTPPTAVERADRMAEMAARMAAETKKRADATRAFYAALTPSQRKVFDTMPGMGGGRMIQIRQMRGPGMPGMPPAPPMPGRPG